MSHHKPFDVEEATRVPFAATPFTISKRPNPGWKPGQGLNGRTDLEGYEAFAHGATLEGSQTDFKHISPDDIPDDKKSDLYKLMIGGINPRPIAFCSSLSETGEANLAPFSYFMACGHQPPMLAVHFTASSPIIGGEGGKHKDTLNNIRDTKEFVVNIISEPFAEAANFTSINAPPGVSEWALSGLTQVPSDLVRPPRVGESAFAMECVLEFIHDIYSDAEKTRLTGSFALARIRKYHVRKDLFGPTGAISPAKLLPVSRMGGITYGRVIDAWDAPRPDWNNLKDDEDVRKALAAGPKVAT